MRLKFYLIPLLILAQKSTAAYVPQNVHRPDGPTPSIEDLRPVVGGTNVVADRAEEAVGKIDNTPTPPPEIKCGQQASKILMAAGQLDRELDGVKELVDEMKKRGWTPCAKAVKGALAYTNPELTPDKRSHIGIVDRNGCVVNNNSFQNPGVGTEGITPVPGLPCTDSGPRTNVEWGGKVEFLAPPGACI